MDSLKSSHTIPEKNIVSLDSHRSLVEHLSSAHTEFIVLSIEYPHDKICHARITIPRTIINKLYHETARILKEVVSAPGFSKGQLPISYIKEHFRITILTHLKEFLFKYIIINTLFKELYTQKITIAGDPRLIDVFLEPDQDAHFIFEAVIIPAFSIEEWKYLPFKAPKRKNYKDLDKQVESFIEQEESAAKKPTSPGIQVNDWVLFGLGIVDENHQLLINTPLEHFWLKISNEDTDNPLRSILEGKQPGDCLHTPSKGLQEYFSNQLDSNYIFYVEVIEVLHSAAFCFDLFKRHFRIKTNKEMSKKLIEVFSYRNDLSQRRATVEEALKLLIEKNRFDVPDHLILREQTSILESIQQNPDYNVYRKQHDFTHKIHQLAEKQVKEKIIIDYIAYRENISFTPQDVKGYLNLTLRPRTKEFIYFKYPDAILDGQEIPIPSFSLGRTCLREKTMNYAIHNLSKK